MFIDAIFISNVKKELNNLNKVFHYKIFLFTCINLFNVYKYKICIFYSCISNYFYYLSFFFSSFLSGVSGEASAHVVNTLATWMVEHPVPDSALSELNTAVSSSTSTNVPVDLSFAQNALTSRGTSLTDVLSAQLYRIASDW